MKLRNDLWKDAQRPAVFAELKKRVQDLLSHSEWTTLLLRGPWGCGKTSAIKSLLNEAKDSSNNDRLKVGTYSFVSLAGISTIPDERSLFLSGIESWKDLPIENVKGLTKTIGKIGKALVAVGGLGSRIEGLPDLLTMAITPLMKGALVILDDLERRSDDLPIDDVMGVVMRLAEERECKVVVISNEDKLKQEDKEKLNGAREKLFDLEFLFNPSTDEAVSAIAANEKDRERLSPVFEALDLNNLRVITKVNAAANLEFSPLFPPDDPEARERILENVVKICAFRWYLGISIESKMLESAFALKFRSEINAKFIPYPDNPLADLILKTEFEPCEGDKAIVDYLRTGRVDKEGLIKAFMLEKSRAAKSRAVSVLQKLEDSFSSSFQTIYQQVIDDAQHTLDKSIEAFSEWSYAFRLFHLLRMCGRTNDISIVERRWAKGCVLPEGGWAAEFCNQLTDGEARAILEKRFEERDKSFRIENFAEMIAKQMFPEALGLLGRHDSEWIYQQLTSAETKGLNYGLMKFWKLLDSDGVPPEVAPVREAFKDALERLSNESSMNRERVNSILSSDHTESGLADAG